MDKSRQFISSEHLSGFDSWEECLRHGKELGFGGIEIFGNDIINGSLSQKNQQAHLKKLSHQYGMALSFHPWLEWVQKPLKEQVKDMRLLLEGILSCGSNQLNLHLDFLTTQSKGSNPIVQLFSDLNSYIKQNNLQIYFENVPQNHSESYGTKPSDFIPIFEALGSSNYFFNLDTGHALLTSGIPAFISQLAPCWNYSHIHDNDGTGDQHKPPGFGIIDWNSFFLLAKEVNYQGIFLYEFGEAGIKDTFDLLNEGFLILEGGGMDAIN